jgi:hypothetical protein
MADTKQTEPIVRTVASITRKGCGPQPHAYDDPDLSAIEFLQAVYRDSSLPMSIRIDAARGLLPYTEPRPASVPSLSVGCTIVIGGLGPCDTDRAQGPSADPTRNHSQNPDPAIITVTRDGDAVAPVNLETTSNPDFVPDYSLPPDPAVFAAALKYGLPEPHLCFYCGHWLTTTYPDCICASRDPSKMN